MPHLALSCFGPFQAVLDGEALARFHSVKAQALLAYLALEFDRPHLRETLATLLWPLDNETSARGSLRQTLYELRKLLGDRDDLDAPFLLVTRQTVQFNPASNHTLDVADFLSSIRDGKLEQAATLYRGELLAGLSCESEPFEEWLRQSRARFHNLAVDCCFKLTDRALEQGDLAQARTYAQRQLTLEPWREEAHRQLMTALALNGERSAALAQYEVCRRILADELGVEPDAGTVTLYEQIKAGKLRGQRTDPLPTSPRLGEGQIARSPPSVRHNLPPQPTPFIGRQNDLAQIAVRLADPACRLLTVVAPGGMGKTRLALQAAQAILDAATTPDDTSKSKIAPKGLPPKFEDGLFYVALAGVASPDLLVSTIAVALDFIFYASGDPKSQLLDYLRPKSMLLVLDNFEHLLDGADLVADLLAAAPGIKVVVTSREALNLQEEWLHPLTGMSFPNDTPGASALDHSTLAQFTAVQLFVQCARQVQPEFDLAVEADAVVRICRLVDGMPLGIELATSWLKLFPCVHIAQEIIHNLDFLATRLRNVSPRHRSMKAVFEHSWGLLTLEEQEIFRRLAVFRGGFTQEAAVAITGASQALLLTFVEKSLLQLTAAQRFQVHELLRQFAEEKLLTASQFATEIQDRHSVYYLNLLQRQEPLLKGREYHIAMATIEADIENIRRAWRWAVTHRQLGSIDRALEGLYVFFCYTTRFREGVAALQLARDALRVENDTGRHVVLLARVLARQGAMIRDMAVLDGAQAAWWQAMQLCQESLDLLNIQCTQDESGETQLILCSLYGSVGRFDDAIHAAQQALAAFTNQQDHYGMERSLNDLGYMWFMRGEYHQALQCYRQSLAVCAHSGNPYVLGSIHNLMGDAYKALGDYREAQLAAQTALRIRTEIGDKRGIGWSLRLLGLVAWHLGDHEVAYRCLTESLDIFQSIGLTNPSEIVHSNLGDVAVALGDHQQARTHFAAVLARNVAAGTLAIHWQVAETLVGMAGLLSKENKQARAIQLLLLAQRHTTAWQETKERAARQLAELWAALTPDDFAAAQAQAERQDLATVVAALLAATAEPTEQQ